MWHVNVNWITLDSIELFYTIFFLLVNSNLIGFLERVITLLFLILSMSLELGFLFFPDPLLYRYWSDKICILSKLVVFTVIRHDV